MIFTLVIVVLALIAGFLLPLRFGVWGYLLVAFVLFALQVAINTASGFGGTPVSESLQLFNNSWTSYFGFNLQITYRAFALPLLALAVPLIFRLSRGAA